MHSKISASAWAQISGLETHRMVDSQAITKVCLPSNPQAEALHFLNDSKELSSTPHPPSTWIVSSKLRQDPALQPLLDNSEISLFFTPSIPYAMSQLLGYFDPRTSFSSDDYRSYQGAWIHATAQIDEQVVLAPGVVIGAGCQIGARTVIRPNATLEALTCLGSDCLIHANTVIGSDGFGFFKDPKQLTIYKIPQIGSVVIGHHVEIGANCAIDRATLTETRIGHYTKLDNLIHLAHNTQIGDSCFLAAGFMCAGSIRIGHHFACGGDVVVSDHISICDHVTIGGRSGVTKDITEPGFYVGYPVEPWKEGLRTLSQIPRLTEMRKELQELRKRVESLGNN